MSFAAWLTGCSSAPGAPVDASVDQPMIKGPAYGFGDDGGEDAPFTPFSEAGTQLSADIIPFNLVPCGTTTTQVLQVFNGGAPPLMLSASTTGTWFSVNPTTLTIPGEAEGMFTVTATVPGSVAAGVTLSGSLGLVTSDPTQPNITIPLTLSPSGGTVTMLSGSSAISFPESEVGEQATAQEFTLVNSGNAPATVTVGAPSNQLFAIVGGQDAGVTLNPGDTWTGAAIFTALDTSIASATSTVTVTGATCATSVAAISFSGQGGYGRLSGWPTAPVDFGPGPCGGAAPVPQLFDLTNAGGVDVQVTNVSISPATSGFTTTALVGDIIPARTGRPYRVTVNAPPVAQPSPLTPITATLTIQTDGDSPHTITLQEEPQGAVLAFDTSASPSFGSFGQVLLLTAAAQNFSVTNTGNAPANVALGTGSSAGASNGADAGMDATASSSGGTSPVFAVSDATFSIAPNGTQTDAVTFTPGTGTNYSGAITMTATGTLCSPPPSPLALSGIGGAAGPLVYPSEVDFLPTCGGPAPVRQAVQIINRGVATMTWSISPITGPGAAQYTMNPPYPASGTLGPAESALLEISAAAIPTPAPNPDPAALSAEFSVTTDVPLDQAHVIPLTETPLGDQLSFSVQELRFGQFPIDHMTPQQTFTVTNAANPGSPAANLTLVLTGAGTNAYVEPDDGGAVCVVPADAGTDASGLCPVVDAGGDGSDAGDGGPEGGDAEPPEYVVAGYLLAPQAIRSLGPHGGVSQPEIATFIPTSSTPYPATIAIHTFDALCSALPAPIQLSGTGTRGQVSLSATTLAFGTDPADPRGLVNCGATGLPRTLTVSNAGNSAFDITELALGAGAISPYSVSGVTLPASVPIAGSVAITLTPSAIPSSVVDPNDRSTFADTLTITTDAAFDTPHEVALVMQARGAVIANRPLSGDWNFGTISLGSIGSLFNAIDNIGNAPAWVALQGLSRPGVFGLQANPTAAAANSATVFVGQFEPPSADGAWTDRGTLVVTAEQVFCQPLPATWSSPTVTLSGGSSSTPPISVAGSLAFPSSECGSAAPGGQAVTLTNNTNQAYGYTFALTSGIFYSVSDPGSGVIAGNGTATIVVGPATISPGPGVEPGAAPYVDSLVMHTFPAALADAGAGSDAGNPEASTFTIPVSWTLNGAVLSLPEGAGPRSDGNGYAFYPVDTTTGFTLPMSNSGNETATVTLALRPANALTFASSGSATLGANMSAAPPLVSTTSDATCPTLTSAIVTFVYSGPVCQPFPVPLIEIQACQGTFP